MAPMPSRRRPKLPARTTAVAIERFAQSLRDSEEADRRAKQAAIDAKNKTTKRSTGT